MQIFFKQSEMKFPILQLETGSTTCLTEIPRFPKVKLSFNLQVYIVYQLTTTMFFYVSNPNKTNLNISRTHFLPITKNITRSKVILSIQ